MAGMDFEFHVGVSGIGELEAGAKAAREFEHALDGARDAELELGASGAGAAAGLTAQSAAMDAAARSVKDLDQKGFAQLNRGISEGAAAARDIETGVRDMGAGFAATRVHVDRSGEALRDMERGSRDAEKGLSDLEGAASAATSSGGGLAALGGLVGPAALPAGIAALAGLAAGAVPAVLSLGAGFGAFGAMAAPALLKVKTGLSDVTYAQQQYQLAKGVEARNPTKGNLAAEQRDLAALKTTWAQLPAPVRGAVHAVQSFEKAWGQASKKSGIQKDALGDIKGLLKDAQDAIPAVTQLAQATAPIVHGMVTGLGKEFKSDGFKSFIKTLTKDEAPAAHALKGIGSAFGGFITELTARESKPGTQMLNSIGHLLKDITPGAVSGLVGLTKGVTGFVNEADKIANSRGVKMLTGIVQNAANLVDNKPGESKHLANNLANSVGGLFGLPKLHDPTIKVRPKLEIEGGGLDGRHFAVKNITEHPVVHVIPKISSADLDKATKAVARLPASTIPVKVMPKDISSDVSKATAGKNIDVKGHVTLSGLGAGIQKQIASLKIPDSKVKISVSVSGVGAVKSQMAGVVSAARSDAAAAKGALGSLAGAGQAAGGALSAGLAAGIMAGEGAVVAAATAVASAAASAVRAAAGIQSPSKVWKALGKNMREGLVLGLEGGKSEVQAAARLLAGDPFRDSHVAGAIKKLRKDVREAFKENKITGGREDALLNMIGIGNKRLTGLVKQRQHLVAEIKAAQALSRSVRQGAIGSADITGIAAADSAGQQAAANPPSAPSSIQAGQKADLHNIRAFTADIRKLKKEGLDKTSIKELLAAGVSGGLPAAQQLLASGKKGVKESAKLQREIIDASKKLGVTGANAAYESGSDIGKGLAAGLKSELGTVVKAIDHLAKELVDEIRKSLGLPPLKGGKGGHGGGGHGHGHGGPGHHHPPVYTPGGGHLFGGGGGSVMHPGPIIVHVHSTLELDGQKVARSVQTHTLQRARRNVSSGMKLDNRAA